MAVGVIASLTGPALASEAASATVVPGTQEWVSTYNGPASSFDDAAAVAVSPSGDTVFVTGRSDGSGGLGDYATVAYSATTGAQEWASRYSDPGNGLDLPEAIGVSPDGSTVFVTGYSLGTSGVEDYLTIAYNADTGATSWMTRYESPTDSESFAKSLVVSHDGSAVYVTGYSGGPSGNDYVTVGYDAATGAPLWTSRYNGPSNGSDQGRAIAISPNDKTVFVTGRSTGIGFDDATVAYSTATGARLWARRYNNSKANGNEFANSVTVGPGGQTVYITGGSAGKTSGSDFATIAYKASTGAQLWISRYNGPANFIDAGTVVAAAPNGSTVVVTGSSWGTASNGDHSSNTDYATIAYKASTGAPLWTERYSTVPNGYDRDDPAGLVISPDGSKVYVTGQSDNTNSETDDATVAYSTATGARLWASLYDDPTHDFDGATALALSPSGDTLYITGFSQTTLTDGDFATIAYKA